MTAISGPLSCVAQRGDALVDGDGHQQRAGLQGGLLDQDHQHRDDHPVPRAVRAARAAACGPRRAGSGCPRRRPVRAVLRTAAVLDGPRSLPGHREHPGRSRPTSGPGRPAGLSSSSWWVPTAGDPAVVQHGDPVGEQHGARAVGDHQGGGGAQHLAQRLLDQRLGVHVERGERVVQHQELRVADDRAGQRQALPLAAGQAQALLADLGVDAVRQLGRRSSAWAVLSARCRAAPAVPSGAPISTFSRTVAENSVGSSKATATTSRSRGPGERRGCRGRPR